MRPDGTGYRQLTTDSDRHRQAAFSPDGLWIVFQTTRDEAGLAAIRTDGGGWQAVTIARARTVTSAAASRDGRWLTWIEGATNPTSG